jgi:uncharacterized membrane protein
MRLSEAAVFKWVVIVGIVAAAIVALTLLTRPLVGALLGLAVVIVGCVYGYRWTQQKWRELGAKK